LAILATAWLLVPIRENSVSAQHYDKVETLC